MTEEKLTCPSCNHGFSMEQMAVHHEKKQREAVFEKEYAEKLRKVGKWSCFLEIWAPLILVAIFVFVLLVLQSQIPNVWGVVFAFFWFTLSWASLALAGYWLRRNKKRLFAEWKKQRYPQ